MTVNSSSEIAIRKAARTLLSEIKVSKDPALVTAVLLAERSGVSRATINRATDLLAAFRIDAEQILMEGRTETQLVSENARLRERMTSAEEKAAGRRAEVEALKESVRTLAQQIQVLALDNDRLRSDLDSLERLRSLQS